MLEGFWSGLGGEFAKQWTARILTPALVFWTAGLVAVWWSEHESAVHDKGLAREMASNARSMQGLPGIAQALLVVGGSILLVASALIAERLTLPLLRLLEGYWACGWPRDPLVRYRRWRRRRRATRLASLAVTSRRGALSASEYLELRRLEGTPDSNSARLQELSARRAQGFDARQVAQLSRTRWLLHQTPHDDAFVMPTRLGDTLRAAERRPVDKYGLDAIVCWNALWLLLPSEVKTEIVQSRSALDNAIRMWLWGALLFVWTPWSWWAIPAGVIVPALAYYVGILGAATLFGELTVTAFDLHRFQLYDALRLPRPQSPIDERQRAGPRITNLLWGGLDEPDLRYTVTAAGEKSPT